MTTLVVLVAACSYAAPAQPTPVDSESPAVEATAASLSPSPTPSGSEPAFAVEIHDIPQEFTTPALEYTTDGRALIWSSGSASDRFGAAHTLWELLPDAARPTQIFASEHPDSSLGSLTGDGAGSYAFVEQNHEELSPAGWRLWYAPAGGEAVAVDHGDVSAGLIPFIALTPQRMIWTALHETEEGVRSQLLMSEPPGAKPTVLHAHDPNTLEYHYPSLDGDALVYSTLSVEPDRAGVGSDVFLMQLDEPDTTPRRLNGRTPAFMGRIVDGTVIWLRPTQGSPLNGGQLIRYSVRDDTSRPIQLGADNDVVNFHSVGSRFVAGETERLTSLEVYDLESEVARSVVELGDQEEGSRPEVIVRPRVSGDLLVYVSGSDDPEVDLTLRWARLPSSERTGTD